MSTRPRYNEPGFNVSAALTQKAKNRDAMNARDKVNREDDVRSGEMFRAANPDWNPYDALMNPPPDLIGDLRKGNKAVRAALGKNSEGRLLPPVDERVVKVGNNVYWRTGDKFYTKGRDGVWHEISGAEYDSVLDKRRSDFTKRDRDAQKYLDSARAQDAPWLKDAVTHADTTHADLAGFKKRDDIEHRDRQARLGFSRDGWVSKEAMDLAETPASKIRGMKNVKTIKAEPGSKVTPQSLKGLSGIGKPDAFKAIADAANRGEEIGSAQVDGKNILYYGDHVIVR